MPVPRRNPEAVELPNTRYFHGDYSIIERLVDIEEMKRELETLEADTWQDIHGFIDGLDDVGPVRIEGEGEEAHAVGGVNLVYQSEDGTKKFGRIARMDGYGRDDTYLVSLLKANLSPETYQRVVTEQTREVTEYHVNEAALRALAAENPAVREMVTRSMKEPKAVPVKVNPKSTTRGDIQAAEQYERLAAPSNVRSLDEATRREYH